MIPVKQKICLILKNNSGWTGGSEYIKNILSSFSYLDLQDRQNVELHLISFESSSVNKKLEKYSDYLHTYNNLRPNFFIKGVFSYWPLFRFSSTIIGVINT